MLEKLTPTRARLHVIGVIALVVIAVCFVLWAIARKQTYTASVPAWSEFDQPPDGIASQVTTLSADQSWAANRCRPMTASCGNRTAGRRLHRTYPATLGHDPCDPVQASFGVVGQVGI